LTVDTGLDISSKLGDFTQVQLGANTPVPIMNGMPGVNVTIANQDLTNTVTIERRPSFQQNASNTATVPPLGSITVDASKTIWGLAPNGTLPVLIFPGGGNWAPSPAQVAAQINALGLMKDTTGVGINNSTLGISGQAGWPTSGLGTETTQIGQNTTIPTNISNTGVPLLGRSGLLHNTSGNVNAGATVNLATKTITKIAYEAFVTLLDNAAGTAKKTVTVQFKFSDSTSGQIVDQVNFDIFPGASGGSAHQVMITGQTAGDTLVVSLTNNDTAQVAYSVVMLECSRVFPHDHQFKSLNKAGGTGAILGSYDILGGLILDTAPAGVAAGTSVDRWLFCYNGPVSIHIGSPGANACTVQFNSLDSQATNDGTIYAKVMTPPPNHAFDLLDMPKSQCVINIKNNAAAAATFTVTIIAEDR